jgi:hypothetical protein
MKGQRVMMCALIVALLLALALVGVQGQQQPEDGSLVVNEPLAELNDAIPIQGRLTDENGVPLDGVFDIRFAVYDVQTGGTPLCQDTDAVGVDNGLFNANLDGCTSSSIDGRQLWLGVKVGSDAEMLYRRPIYAVPYAWSLRPGASIVNTSLTSAAVGLYTASAAPAGKGLYGHASTTSADGWPVGVFGHADALQGIGVYGYTTSGAGSGYGGFFANLSASGDLIAANDSSSLITDLEFRVSNDGEVYADGSFHAGGADFAELLPAAAGLEPGDVLVVGPGGRLARSTAAYQLTVVGVYSTNPGIVAGGEDGKVFSEIDLSGKAPLAVMGIVPVKASAENGAISPGDLLVASGTPGHAMKAGPNPPAGAVVGKALEGLASGVATIQMLVMLR